MPGRLSYFQVTPPPNAQYHALTNRVGDVRNLHTQNFGGFVLHSQAIHLIHIAPFAQGHNEVQLLFATDTFTPNIAPISTIPMPRTSMVTRHAALVPITRPSMSLSLVTSSATRLYRSTSASTHSLFPIPPAFHNHLTENIHHAAVFLSARRKQILQRERGALINFMVINGLRKTGIESLSAKARNSLSGRRFLKTPPRNLYNGTPARSAQAFFLERFVISRLSRTDGLNAFARKDLVNSAWPGG